MKFNQATVASLDIEKSISFYQKLGLRLIVESPHYARFECPEGDATFSIHLVLENKLSNTVLYFEVDDLEQRVRELECKGLVFTQQPKQETWLWHEARLMDPSDNEICIYHAGENRKNPPWRIQ